MELQEPLTAYHFTKIDSAFQIIQFGNFRLTHIDYLNDPKETTILLDAFRKRCLDEFDSSIPLGMIETLSKFISSHFTYSLSLSTELYEIPMWSYYSGEGIALEFEIDPNCSVNGIGKEYIDYISDYDIDEAIELYIQEFKKKLEINNNFHAEYFKAAADIIGISINRKHNGFSYENEFRINYTNHYLDESTKRPKLKKKIVFHHNGQMVKPYIDCSFDELGIKLKNIHVSEKAIQKDETLLPGLEHLIQLSTMYPDSQYFYHHDKSVNVKPVSVKIR